MAEQSYIITSGQRGRERLRVLARVMLPGTLQLFDQLGVREGWRCLDSGCGGGDVTFELARRVAPRGRVTGIDLDEEKLELARTEARSRQLANVEFVSADVSEYAELQGCDMVYSRFVLTHLREPARALNRMLQSLRPGGLLAVEDIDFRGHFCYPACPAFDRYVELYTQAVRERGADPEIGPRLPLLLRAAGFENVAMKVVQPAGYEGEVKLVNPITLAGIADALVASGLATNQEIQGLLRELQAFAEDSNTVMSIARVIQCWGCAPEETGGDYQPV